MKKVLILTTVLISLFFVTEKATAALRLCVGTAGGQTDPTCVPGVYVSNQATIQQNVPSSIQTNEPVNIQITPEQQALIDQRVIIEQQETDNTKIIEQNIKTEISLINYFGSDNYNKCKLNYAFPKNPGDTYSASEVSVLLEKIKYCLEVKEASNILNKDSTDSVSARVQAIKSIRSIISTSSNKINNQILVTSSISVSTSSLVSPKINKTFWQRIFGWFGISKK